MAHDEAATPIFNVEQIELKNVTGSAVTQALSGSIYVSGGEIWAKGGKGTDTQLAAA